MDDAAFKFVIPSFCSTAAIITAVFFGFGCQSFMFQGRSVTYGGIAFDMPDLYFAPWYTEKTYISDSSVSSGTLYITTQDVCVDWKAMNRDTIWTFVQAATIITPALGFILTVLMCCTPCITAQVAKLWHCMAISFIVILTTFQGLTFLFEQSNACTQNPLKTYLQATYQNDYSALAAQYPQFAQTVKTLNVTAESLNNLWAEDCEWASGAVCSVVATACWFLTGALMLALGSPRVGDFDDEGPAKEVEEPAGDRSPEEPKEPEEGGETPDHPLDEKEEGADTTKEAEA